MNNKTLVIMHGIPGSGKTFTCEQMVPKEHIFSTDDYFMKNGKYKFDHKKLGIAHEWNTNRVDIAMQQEQTPIHVCNTNIKKSDYKRYIQLANCHGYEVNHIIPTSSWFTEIYPRIQNKTFTDEDVNTFVDKTIHNVPFDTIKKMMNNWEDWN